jgi:hypothetical protein
MNKRKITKKLHSDNFNENSDCTNFSFNYEKSYCEMNSRLKSDTFNRSDDDDDYADDYADDKTSKKRKRAMKLRSYDDFNVNNNVSLTYSCTNFSSLDGDAFGWTADKCYSISCVDEADVTINTIIVCSIMCHPGYALTSIIRYNVILFSIPSFRLTK